MDVETNWDHVQVLIGAAFWILALFLAIALRGETDFRSITTDSASSVIQAHWWKDRRVPQWKIALIVMMVALVLPGVVYGVMWLLSWVMVAVMWLCAAPYEVLVVLAGYLATV